MTLQKRGGNCPICSSTAQTRDNDCVFDCDCPRCGTYKLTSDGNNSLTVLEENLGAYNSDWNKTFIHRRSQLSHHIRRRFDKTKPRAVIFNWNDVGNWELDDPLPNPVEQCDALILWIGEHQSSASESTQVPLEEVSAWVGLPVSKQSAGAGLGWLLDQEEIKTLLDERSARISSPFSLRLKMAGWARYEELTRRRVESRTAFMATKFEEEVIQVVNSCFKPAVAKTDFELRMLTDGQPAGLIDDQIRVSLRRAKFVVADLTHNNNGAYWEAGFAEGLGCPVIYTCREDIWSHKDKEKRPHFDTNHLATIIWNPDKLNEAATKLTAMIRATFPDAKQTDN